MTDDFFRVDWGTFHVQTIFFCILESSQALFTIFNLQLFERVSEGKILLTEGQMDKVFDTVQKFFDANGIEAQ